MHRYPFFLPWKSINITHSQNEKKKGKEKKSIDRRIQYERISNTDLRTYWIFGKGMAMHIFFPNIVMDSGEEV